MQEHGHFTIVRNNQLIIIKAFDGWNLETALRLCLEYKSMAELIKSKPWATLVDLSQWQLSTPDVFKHINKINEWCNKNNKKFEAVICSSSMQKTLVNHTHKLLTDTETQIFTNWQDAQQWLASVGFPVAESD